MLDLLLQELPASIGGSPTPCDEREIKSEQSNLDYSHVRTYPSFYTLKYADNISICGW